MVPTVAHAQITQRSPCSLWLAMLLDCGTTDNKGGETSVTFFQLVHRLSAKASKIDQMRNNYIFLKCRLLLERQPQNPNCRLRYSDTCQAFGRLYLGVFIMVFKLNIRIFCEFSYCCKVSQKDAVLIARQLLCPKYWRCRYLTLS